MHLDLKPKNMVYFRDPNGGPDILKAIDFGASILLNASAGELKDRANIRRRVYHAVTTLSYDGPENNYKNVLGDKPIWEESAERTFPNRNYNLVIFNRNIFALFLN
jgi:serine/threonine protein kinase